MEHFTVTGMSCAACQARVEKAVGAVPGVESCAVSLLTNSMSVEGTASPSDIIAAVTKAGYGAKLRGDQGEKRTSAAKEAEELLRDTETPVLKRRLLISAVFLAILMYITMGHNMWGAPIPRFLEHDHVSLGLIQLLLAAAVMIINQKFFVNGYRSLFRGAPNMDTLVALGSTASFGWSVYVLFKLIAMANSGATRDALMEVYHNELYFESAAMIPALITVGKLLEAISKGRTTNALRSLVSLAPKTANVIRDGAMLTVPAEDVRVGDVFTVGPGEAVPVDGEVIEGSSAIDESALTGESIPVDKSAGDRVSSATMNTWGFLTCRATRVGEDTTLSGIIRLVEGAAATKAPIARIADKVSAVFVPAVMAIAALVVGFWLISGKPAGYAVARGISVLVISCPCALGLATPVAVMVGNGLGARNGILIKTGEALETSGRIDTVVLDKTGTITEGSPAVQGIFPAAGVTENELILKARSLEEKSEHPLARAIVAEADRLGIEPLPSEEFMALAGSGLTAKVGGKQLYGGNLKHILTCAAPDEALIKTGEKLAAEGKTPLYFAEEGRMLGLIAVADALKQSSPAAIGHLKDLGIRVVMLTGDNEATANAIGREAGVSEVIAGVLPEGKAAAVRSLQSEGKVAMVGDGINDAPALTSADIGIAIGAGTDVAIDSADVVLMNSDLEDVAASVRLGRGTLRNIHENLFWAFFYNVICIPLAAGFFGLKMNPMYGAAAMSLSSVTVCLNALRLNLLNIKDPKHDKPLNKLFKRKTPSKETQADDGGAAAAESTIVLRIEGMMCHHCEASVKNALEALPFVSEAEASFEAGTAKVKLSAPPDEDAIKKAIESEDYEYLGIAE